jgi:hypothetical protein
VSRLQLTMEIVVLTVLSILWIVSIPVIVNGNAYYNSSMVSNVIVVVVGSSTLSLEVVVCRRNISLRRFELYSLLTQMVFVHSLIPPLLSLFLGWILGCTTGRGRV